MIAFGRVRLSPYVRGLRQTLFDWMNDPETRRAAGEFRAMSEPDLDAWIGRVASAPGNAFFFIVERDAPAPVGFALLADIAPLHRHARVSIAIPDPARRGRGHGGDALRALIDHGFRDLGLERIHLDVLVSNEGAIRLYRRLGFVEEGIRRRHFYVDGNFRDVLSMAVLRRPSDPS